MCLEPKGRARRGSSSIRRAAVLATLTTILCALSTLLAAQELAMTKIDTSGFPDVRVYVSAPEGVELAEAEPRVELDYDMPPELADARAFVRDRQARSTEKGQLYEGPAIPDDPGDPIDARILSFADQNDETEGLLVVVLVDVSGSMASESGGRSGMQRVRDGVAALLSDSGSALRPIDRVGLVTFADDIQVAVAPTTDHGRVLERLRRLDLLTGPHKTYLYDAVVNTIQQVVAAEENPTLPGRRLLVVFSDGRDEGSSHQVSDILPVLDALDTPPTIVTVGVGDPEQEADLHGDLNRIATFAGGGDRFLETPTASTLRSTLRDILAIPRRETLVEFRVPELFWSAAPQGALLRFSMSDGRDLNVPFDIAPGRLTVEQREEHSARLTEDADLLSWHDEILRREQKTKLAIVGGSGLFIFLALLFLVSRRRKREKKNRQAELQSMQENIEKRIDEQIGEQQAELLREAERNAKRATDRERRPLALLSALDGPLKGQRFGVLRPEALIGRDAEKCDLVFPDDDAAISRVHLRLCLGDGAWEATCLSDGGMAVNNAQLHKGDRYAVQFGDRFILGKTTFEFGAPT